MLELHKTEVAHRVGTLRIVLPLKQVLLQQALNLEELNSRYGFTCTLLLSGYRILAPKVYSNTYTAFKIKRPKRRIYLNFV